MLIHLSHDIESSITKETLVSCFMYSRPSPWLGQQRKHGLSGEWLGSGNSVKQWHTARLVTWRHYSQTPLNRHQLDEETSLPRAFFVPGEAQVVSNFNIWFDMDTPQYRRLCFFIQWNFQRFCKINKELLTWWNKMGAALLVTISVSSLFCSLPVFQMAKTSSL